MNVKILNKILANRIQQHIKKIIYHDQVGFSKGCKDSSIYTNQSMWFIILTNWKIKNCMVISIDSKIFWQNLAPIYNKNSLKHGHRCIEGTYLNVIKAICDKPTTDIILKWWKTESIPFKIGNKTRVPTLISIIQHSFGSPGYGNQRRKINNRNMDWKRRIKTLTVADDTTLYIENGKVTIRKLLELSSEFNSHRIQNRHTEITCIPIC